MNNQIIVSLLERYCEIQNTQKTGLLLLDLPTGFGKTYEVLRFIYENYDKTDKKIIFLTNLKKNLPHETLKKFFVKENKTAEYDKNIVFINANVDCVLENLLENENLMPENIKNEKVFKNLKTQIEFHNSLNKKEKGKSPQETQLCDKIKEGILEDYEPAFRQFVTGLFYQKAKTKEERIKLLTNNKDFKWVAKVYPAALSFEKKVFFLSMDKFLVKNSPIVESSYAFFDDSFLKNALIFIDEFDASKEVLLKNIIEN